ncbi:site-specific integrase [Cupriavidus pinatubonensis]|uniref:site-specific integrase n=1 Tax=Cupriavidus pinatubonensis TaxID=248026 RepID=UPI00112939AE|nr:site-specific integrase [Cupriavidus pinatubonensis]TPQ31824.1 hypothetical protein C2U69_27695 [Cupriavidus pinatubonensis]
MAHIYLSSLITMKVKYLWRKTPTGSYYYKRPVPKDVQGPGGRRFVQVCLHTTDPKEAARKIQALAAKSDQEWEHQRNPSRATTIAQATRMLHEHGVDPSNPQEDPEALDVFFDMVEGQLPERVREAHYDAYQEGLTIGPKDIDQHLPPATAAALAMAQGRMSFLASDCRDQYIQARAHTDRAVRAATIPFNYLIELFGDRDIGKYKRAEANKYVQHLLSGGHSSSGKGIATTTVQRYITTLRAAWELAIKENELDLKNPWSAVEIPKLGKDAQKRESFTVPDYKTMYDAIDSRELDGLRCILTLVAETGARLGEIVGLPVSDCHLKASVPYIQLQPHPWRSLKTTQSTRKVPLTDRAVKAISKALQLRGDSPYLFPHYTDGTVPKRSPADAVSQALNKWLRARGLPDGLTCHSLRHGMRDLMREVGCPDSVANQFLGWESEGQGAKYGAGYSLGQLREWLDKATALYVSPDH